MNMHMNLSRRGIINATLGALALTATGAKAKPANIKTDIDTATLPSSKTTPLGLYLSPRAAYEALQANPKILFVDVRDPIEVTFVGHAKGLTKIIPIKVATHEVNPKSGQYQMAKNPSFVAEFEALLAEKNKTKSDPVFVSCRSGGRSAAAAKLLIAAGFSNVWNLTEGFEGDKTSTGVRALNGWRNADLPWTYKLAPGVAWKK